MKEPLTNIQYAEALEAIAAFYRANPEMPQIGKLSKFFAGGREPFLKAVKALANGGMVRKWVDEPDDSYPYYHAERDFGGVQVELSVFRRDVCRLVEPARPAVYECPDSLLEEAAEFEERSNG
jgi:hypothetical protein